MSPAVQHTPVLKREALAALNVMADGAYVDATFGRGGHSSAIVEQLSASGRLFAIDRDPRAIASATELFGDDERVKICHAAFDQMADAVDTLVDGILLDLGVSSPQLDDATRGFSFMRDGELDMRMDISQGETAAQWLARVDEDDLITVLFRYGEEKFARRIARAIVEARRQNAITHTRQLADIVVAATPKKDPHKHSATRTFQAIRIQINQELAQIERALPQAVRLLAPNARLAVISFHSLEDRQVKRFMRAYATPKLPPKHVPTQALDYRTPLKLIGKAVKPSITEIDQNARARSAILRVAERTDLGAAELSNWEANYVG